MTSRIQCYLAACGLGLILIAGCGAPVTMVPVTGTVTYDSKPLEQGLIEFYPVAPTPGAMAGASIERGAYSVPGDKGLQVKGKYTVKITATRKSGKQTTNILPGGSGQMDLYEQFLPETYNTKSKLEAAIADPSKRKFDFNLKADGQ